MSRRRGRGKGRENLKRTLLHRAKHRAQFHESEIMTWAKIKSWTLSGLSHPHNPSFSFNRAMYLHGPKWKSIYHRYPVNQSPPHLFLLVSFEFIQGYPMNTEANINIHNTCIPFILVYMRGGMLYLLFCTFFIPLTTYLGICCIAVCKECPHF